MYIKAGPDEHVYHDPHVFIRRHFQIISRTEHKDETEKKNSNCN